MTRKTRTREIYVVIFDTDGPGDIGDGVVTRRFEKRPDAERFAEGRTIYGRPAQVMSLDATAEQRRRYFGRA